MKLLLIIFFSSVASNVVAFRSGKIVGGSDVSITDFPYQLSLRYRRSIHSCGGTLIKDNWVLTAAHCTYGDQPADWKVKSGITNLWEEGQIRDVIRIMNHPSFTFDMFNDVKIDFDISLLETIAFELNANTWPIALPSENDSEPPAGTLGWVTGWGATREGGQTVAVLQGVEVPVVDQSVCAKAYENITPVTDRMLCAGVFETGGKDACQGDSGGPLMINGVLYGVSSFGYGCARPRYPGVYTRVTAFLSWIESTID